MIDLWLKALHVAAVIAFVGGMLAAAVLLAALTPARPPSQQQRTAIEVVRQWDRIVTTPAMLLVWTLGLVLALRGGWFSSVWLPIKLVLVVALSSLHGMQSGTLRRMAGDADHAPSRTQRLFGPLVLTVATAIAILVIVKPF